MSIGLRFVLILISIVTMIYMLRKIRQSKLQIEYAIFWIFFSFMLIFISIFPKVVYWMTSLIGIQSPVNFIFLAIIFILIMKNFMMTLQLSQTEGKLRELIQKFALLEKDIRDKERKKKHEG